MLLVTKDLESRGGVANYYRLFVQEFKANDIKLRLFSVGSRNKDYYKRNERNASYLKEYILDIRHLILSLLRDKSIKIVQVSPSLLPVPLIRDGFIILISKFFRKKVVVFYRGWRDSFVLKIRENPHIRFWFRFVFQRADASIFLATKFLDDLEKSNIRLKNIQVTRTFFLKSRLENLEMIKKRGLPKFVFISRISKKKGTVEILKACEILLNSKQEFLIEFYGHFADLEFKSSFFALVSELQIDEMVKINPYITEEEKYIILRQSDVFILPSYEEGCPNSVIEAMASGCFIISSDAGALPEIVKNGINGLIMEDITAENLAEKMAYAIDNIEIVREKGKSNIKYAYDNFEAESHIKNMENLYRSLV